MEQVMNQSCAELEALDRPPSAHEWHGSTHASLCAHADLNGIWNTRTNSWRSTTPGLRSLSTVHVCMTCSLWLQQCVADGGLGNSQRILVGGEQDTSCVLAHHVGLLQLCGSYASTTSAPPQAY
eukprot:scaffold77111_cov22-Tisochrysis_lutea.AAC.1